MRTASPLDGTKFRLADHSRRRKHLGTTRPHRKCTGKIEFRNYRSHGVGCIAANQSRCILPPEPPMQKCSQSNRTDIESVPLTSRSVIPIAVVPLSCTDAACAPDITKSASARINCEKRVIVIPLIVRSPCNTRGNPCPGNEFAELIFRFDSVPPFSVLRHRSGRIGTT